MSKKQEMPNTGYAIIRCDDGVIVARLTSFPVCERALMYRRGDIVSFMPLQPDEIVGTLSLFSQMIEKARSGVGYHVPPGSVTLPS
ncbi:hypothetical protein LB384_24425 [Klebsiella pneumoniae]|nr:hypothetical protein [Klebsiella variicola]MCD5797319.1 hypothetical protein [Klebsiella pneumoniae]MCD5833280.1 hypothetical protein [Klebsiella pneumoniae]MCD5931460.1 hypothetical protein [Klebsiella pneumoniae]MCJ5286560.1 hypothetical protein [Klebsiella variicola]MCJ5304873.1 hypothetical protein [Klebsiella variicola]